MEYLAVMAFSIIEISVIYGILSLGIPYITDISIILNAITARYSIYN
jgi:hypothetical protein